MRKIISCLLILIPLLVCSQNLKKIDSINQIILKTQSDSIKAVEYLTVSNLHIQKDSIFNNLTKSLFYARKTQVPKYISNTRINFANWYQSQTSTQRSLKEHFDAINELEKYNFKSGIANHYINIGYKYNTINKDSMHLYLDKGVKLANESKDNNAIVAGLLTLGNLSFFEQEHDKALEYYIKAEEICVKDKNLINSIKHARSLEYIGYVMEGTKKYDKSTDYFNRSFEIVSKLGYTSNIAEMQANIAQQHILKGELAEAVLLLSESIAYYETFTNPSNKLISVLIKRGFCYLRLNKFKETEEDLLKALEISKLPINKKHYTYALFSLADAYSHFKDYDNAEKYYKEAEVLGKEEKNNGNLHRIYRGLAKIEIAKKNDRMAKNYLILALNASQLEQKENLDDAILKLETKYQTEKKEKEIELLTLKNDIAKKQKYYYVGFLGLILLISVLIFLVFRNKIKTAAKEKELNRIKSHFFSNISHEFRTPLTLINGPLIKLLENKNLNNDVKPDLELIQKNTNRLIELVDQMLELSKLDAGVVKISVEKGNLEFFLKASTDSFKFLAKERKLKLHSSIDKMQTAWFDTDILDKIINNLFSNALKYTAPLGEITFDGFIKDDKELVLSITNDVENFNEKNLGKLFERFYQIQEQSDGAGIGLSMIKELVNLLHGKIETKIIDSKKINFKIILPIYESAFSLDEKVMKRKSNDIENDVELIKIPTNAKPIILIVDDNKSIRDYTASLLTESYNILKSKDGKEGVEMALKHMPDIIISDVMMPLVNGIELCNVLKRNQLTSHIPIILLTAKSGDINEISGLESGADDYITKPFNPKTLQIKINNIIQNRIKIHQRYKQDNLLRPKEIAVTSADEAFLKKVQNILDQHLSNPDFNAEIFSKHVAMSRMQLHRKMLAYTGLATSNFIRSQRLKQATIILQSSQYTINEIAFMVGFNTPSYFIKCFKETYGQTPLEYNKK